MNTFSLTDKGRVRENNQDSVYSSESSIGKFPNLFIVADGMGGHRAGDQASRMCIEEVVRCIGSSDKVTQVSALEEAVNKANISIYEASNQIPEFQGMGTTVVATTVVDNTAYIINVGDSRLYHYSSKLSQITVDHSLVEEMLQSGEIEKEEMRTHPNKNIITRALGTGEYVRPDCFEIDVEKGDVLLLCSDGLTNMVEDALIEEVISKSADMQTAGSVLVQLANDAGGLDNISVVLIQI